jgi:hypothetical protein
MAAHTGGGSGWRTRTVLLPDDGLGLSVMLNVDGKTGTAIQHRLLERCLDLPSSPWYEIVRSGRAASAERARAKLDTDFPGEPRPPLPAAAIQGRYRNAESGIALVAAEADQLVIHFEDCASVGGRLLPLGGAVYEIEMTGSIATYDGPNAPSPRLRFTDTAAGVSSSFLHSSMGEFPRC